MPQKPPPRPTKGKPGGQTKTCAKCGYKVGANATRCPHCGAPVK